MKKYEIFLSACLVMQMALSPTSNAREHNSTLTDGVDESEVSTEQDEYKNCMDEARGTAAKRFGAFKKASKKECKDSYVALRQKVDRLTLLKIEKQLRKSWEDQGIEVTPSLKGIQERVKKNQPSPFDSGVQL